MISLDLVASIFCGWMALCLFTVHVLSSPKRHPWMNLPEYVRRGVLVTGALFMWRSVNFTTLTQSPEAIGRINAEGLMALGSMCYLVTSLAVWIGMRHLPKNVWARLGWVERVEKDDPDQVPVMLKVDEATRVMSLRGHIAVPPGAPPRAFIKATLAAKSPESLGRDGLP